MAGSVCPVMVVVVAVGMGVCDVRMAPGTKVGKAGREEGSDDAEEVEVSQGNECETVSGRRRITGRMERIIGNDVAARSSSPEL